MRGAAAGGNQSVPPPQPETGSLILDTTLQTGAYVTYPQRSRFHEYKYPPQPRAAMSHPMQLAVFTNDGQGRCRTGLRGSVIRIAKAITFPHET